MRTKALILLFPFVVFLTETASFIPGIKEACTIVAAKKSPCCKMQRPGDCHQQKKAEEKNTPGKKCEDSPDCSTCPVCFTFIFQPQYEWFSGGFILKKSYSLLNTDPLSFYSTDVWKPPNPSA